MTAYPLTAWTWRRPTLPDMEAHHSVSDLLNRLQGRLPLNLLSGSPGDESGLQGSATAASGGILPAGHQTVDSPATRTGAAARHRSRQVVTAVRTPDNQLALASWRVNADGSVIKTGASGPQPDQVAQVELVRASKFVVAYRSLAQELRLVSWDVSNTGAIYRAGESELWPERVRRVRLCAVDEHLLVTVCIMRNRRLKLISWKLGADAAFTPRAEINGSALDVRDLAAAVIAQKDGHPLVVTVMRVGTGQLALQVWQVSPEGMFSPGAQMALPAVATNLQAVVDDNGHLITAMRTLAGGLRLIGWRLAADGEIITPLFDTGESVELIRDYRMAPVPGGVVAAVATIDGHLKLIRWRLATDGAFRRMAESQTELAPLGPLLFCPELLDGNAPLFAGIGAPQGLFQVRTWRM
ncbi:MAG: hypothetical protein DCC55_04360 [Chloroflexi bacterium]|nr:MAG: hypothetical protein DCC55_04360 [Chloroflexota bacterium]